MTRDPFDPGTGDLRAPVLVEPFGKDVPASLIVGADEIAWSVAFARHPVENGRRSIRACKADWHVWTAFCRTHQVRFLPATLDQIRAFCEEVVATGGRRGTMRETIDRYLATLTLAHRAADLSNPLDTAEGKLVVRAIRRNRKLRTTKRRGVANAIPGPKSANWDVR